MPGNLVVKYTPDGGTLQTVKVAGNAQGGLVFFGLAGLGLTSQFTLELSSTFPGTRDIISLDDLRWTTVVPEPSSFGLIGLGSAFLFLMRKRFRSRPNR